MGVVVDVGVEVVTEEEGEDKVKVKVEGEVIKVGDKTQEVRLTPNTRPRDMLTCPRSRPASGTGPMGNPLIFV